MKYLATLLVSAAAVIANTVTFKSLDNQLRTVYFTPNAGHAEVDSVVVEGGDSVKVDFPEKWQGNFIAVHGDGPKVDGMLGEVSFEAWAGITFFDVSAIVVPDDMDNIHMMYPVGDEDPTSGCVSFPCNNAYYLWDDVQTKATMESDLVCTLGYNGVEHKRSVDNEEEHNHLVFKRDVLSTKQ